MGLVVFFRHLVALTNKSYIMACISGLVAIDHVYIIFAKVNHCGSKLTSSICRVVSKEPIIYTSLHKVFSLTTEENSSKGISILYILF